MKSRLLVFLALIATACLLGGPAVAGDGASDPGGGTSKLEIKSVSDSMDQTYVTYRVEFYNGFNSKKDVDQIDWSFDLNGDGRTSDMCIRLESIYDGRMRAVLYPKCGPEAWATAEGVRPSPNIVQFKFRIWDLVNGGGVPPGKTIAYQVLSSDFAGHQDIVPKHGLVQETPIPEFAVGNAPGPHAANAPNELAESGSRNTGANAASAASSSGASGSSGFPTGWIVVVFILVALVAGFFGFAAPRVLARRRRSISQAPAREEVDQMAHAGVGLPDGGPSKSMTTSAAHTADASDAAGAVGPSERDPFAEGWPIDALNARQEGSSHPKPPEHREGEGPGVHAPDA